MARGNTQTINKNAKQLKKHEDNTLYQNTSVHTTNSNHFTSLKSSTTRDTYGQASLALQTRRLRRNLLRNRDGARSYEAQSIVRSLDEAMQHAILNSNSRNVSNHTCNVISKGAFGYISSSDAISGTESSSNMVDRSGTHVSSDTTDSFMGEGINKALARLIRKAQMGHTELCQEDRICPEILRIFLAGPTTRRSVIEQVCYSLAQDDPKQQEQKGTDDDNCKQESSNNTDDDNCKQESWNNTDDDNCKQESWNNTDDLVNTVIDHMLDLGVLTQKAISRPTITLQPADHTDESFCSFASNATCDPQDSTYRHESADEVASTTSYSSQGTDSDDKKEQTSDKTSNLLMRVNVNRVFILLPWLNTELELASELAKHATLFQYSCSSSLRQLVQNLKQNMSSNNSSQNKSNLRSSKTTQENTNISHSASICIAAVAALSLDTDTMTEVDFFVQNEEEDSSQTKSSDSTKWRHQFDQILKDVSCAARAVRQVVFPTGAIISPSNQQIHGVAEETPEQQCSTQPSIVLLGAIVASAQRRYDAAIEGAVNRCLSIGLASRLLSAGWCPCRLRMRLQTQRVSLSQLIDSSLDTEMTNRKRPRSSSHFPRFDPCLSTDKTIAFCMDSPPSKEVDSSTIHATSCGTCSKVTEQEKTIIPSQTERTLAQVFVESIFPAFDGARLSRAIVGQTASTVGSGDAFYGAYVCAHATERELFANYDIPTTGTTVADFASHFEPLKANKRHRTESNVITPFLSAQNSFSSSPRSMAGSSTPASPFLQKENSHDFSSPESVNEKRQRGISSVSCFSLGTSDSMHGDYHSVDEHDGDSCNSLSALLEFEATWLPVPGRAPLRLPHVSYETPWDSLRTDERLCRALASGLIRLGNGHEKLQENDVTHTEKKVTCEDASSLSLMSVGLKPYRADSPAVRVGNFATHAQTITNSMVTSNSISTSSSGVTLNNREHGNEALSNSTESNTLSNTGPFVTNNAQSMSPVVMTEKSKSTPIPSSNRFGTGTRSPSETWSSSSSFASHDVFTPHFRDLGIGVVDGTADKGTDIWEKLGPVPGYGTGSGDTWKRPKTSWDEFDSSTMKQNQSILNSNQRNKSASLDTTNNNATPKTLEEIQEATRTLIQKVLDQDLELLQDASYIDLGGYRVIESNQTDESDSEDISDEHYARLHAEMNTRLRVRMDAVQLRLRELQESQKSAKSVTSKKRRTSSCRPSSNNRSSKRSTAKLGKHSPTTVLHGTNTHYTSIPTDKKNKNVTTTNKTVSDVKTQPKQSNAEYSCDNPEVSSTVPMKTIVSDMENTSGDITLHSNDTNTVIGIGSPKTHDPPAHK